ncbi:hypothetical protein B9Q02_09670 [Candidatus Marsarchaeota G1 archaeon BE_D]|uniref:Uncharacterized protein n=1 Tax=Candidatus Marsarchaeota G1 archaeon BE_D TaxID=1978156 RepID=A0A2R6AD48_9ARCH|nr:MAG: hypothetical protein B9Q02_09670 [Candidatus Marsarchaeota G1 archaeon BE_D]
MPSKSLEALLVLSVTLALSFALLSQTTLKNDACGVNPLSEINLAIQTAVSAPFSNQSVKIPVSGLVVFKGNWVVFSGCYTSFANLVDPNHIIAYYNSTSIEYKIYFDSLFASTPATLSISYEKNVHKIVIKLF